MARRAAPPPDAPRLPPDVVARLREELPGTAERVVAGITADVPSYRTALAGPMGMAIRDAVQTALGGFLSLASGRVRRAGGDPRTPTASAVEGAYQLGRGEARSGRSTDALLAAYRIGARISWRELSTIAVREGLDPAQVAAFAELIFAFIDELSAASAAGHADELAESDRQRRELLDRLTRLLLEDGPAETVLDLAGRAEWPLPHTLTAVAVPPAQVRPVLAVVPATTLVLAEAPGGPDAVLLVPDLDERGRAALLRTAADRGCVVGPPRPWAEASASWQRVARARDLGLTGDTDEHLVALVLAADAAARDDLRRRVLAPLDGLRPASVERLVETLRAWLLHQGRREDVAAALFVHPQTVRYRMQQLRERYGEALDDPATVLALVVALG
ncbi:helix-turn-helix domain-containing protein [Nocardioides sp. TRM66260-LWL]|uniref:helix-turn-helix domain-containing protein n=1 Tax=Nocardioides sp. TRM66260-LWL TaxID=2874478 RepID=UPI001CC4CC88|nr:helix-turn-helix domain-containing protein [Nocardioides sp. TRM66260-LWL]MBZ5735701.1 helix-turn-helix domain-containing protein [Nocardioides sp. TRM66260-LWL]